jgi:hypothetical protein
MGQIRDRSLDLERIGNRYNASWTGEAAAQKEDTKCRESSQFDPTL